MIYNNGSRIRPSSPNGNVHKVGVVLNVQLLQKKVKNDLFLNFCNKTIKYQMKLETHNTNV